MFLESSPSKRTKMIGALLSVVALALVGVVMFGGETTQPVNSLERAQAIARIENANVPMADLPDESQVHVPQGWDVESDKPLGVVGEEYFEDEKKLDRRSLAEDDDIDSPLDVEEDDAGDKYIAQVDDDVIVMRDVNANGEQVVADGTTKAQPQKCYGGLKRCGYRKRCNRLCKKKCKPYAVRVCAPHKFCKCFCQHFNNIAKARKCVIYKKTKCRRAVQYRCFRECDKFCARVPRCYCCARQHIRRACKKLCKKISYKTKCGNCRCYRLKCYKMCRFVCKQYKK